MPRTVVIAGLLALLGAGACRDRLPYDSVAVDPADRISTTPARGPARGLRFGLAAMLSPHRSTAAWHQVVSELGKQLGRRVELVHGMSYHRVNDMLLAGQVDLALICTGGYLALRKRYPAVEILALPQVGGKTTYRSVIIVPAKSTVKRFEQLRGKRFAFTDPLSQTGFVYPASKVLALGTKISAFFGEYSYVGAHDRAILSVRRGAVDGAGIDELVLEYMRRSQPASVAGLRVIDRSPEFGIPPVVAGRRTTAAQRRRWSIALRKLHREATAAAALRSAGVDRFVAPEPGIYQSAAALRAKIGKIGAPSWAH